MNAQSDQAKAIFLEALEKPTPAERSAFLDSTCGTDAALRQRVETLLRAHRPDDSFLDPGKLHPQHTPSGHTQTSDFSDTSTVNKSSQPSGKLLPELAQYFDPPQQPDSLGRFLHYEVLELLPRGGCGIVYRVFDTKLHRVVALKIMSPTLASHPASRLRFIREARTAAAVRHEHVISIHAVDETPLPHLIMEYISGLSLQQKIDKTGSLTTKEVLRIGYQIALGLEAAHKQGLIHRDIKPANILLENGIERVKITDFGLARAIDDTNISHQGLIIGTPSYMSPEQAEGQPVDARSDLFSLGSTMYAMCAGQSPFQGSSTLTVLKRVVEEKPRSLKEANPEIPDWLEAVIMKLLAKKPEERYQTAKEVSDILADYLSALQMQRQVKVESPDIQQTKSPGFFNELGTFLIIFICISALFVLGNELYYSLFGAKPPVDPVVTATAPASPRLLKAFDPKIDAPRQRGNIPQARYDPIKTEEGAWRLEFSNDAHAFTFLFSTNLKQIPTQGAIICKAKVKFKKLVENSQLSIVFHEGDGKPVKYYWPTQHLDRNSDINNWTDIVLRYPAITFASSSPQLTLGFHLIDHGIVHVKDLAFHYEPAKPPVITSRTAELVKSAEAAKKQWEAVEAQFDTIEKGNGSIEHEKAERKARLLWLQNAITLAEDQQDQDGLIFHLMKLKELHNARVQAKHAGSALAQEEPDLAVLQDDLARTESRLMQLLNPSVIGSERLLKRFDPKVEKPEPAPWADPAKTVFVEDGVWRVDYQAEAGLFYFAFSPLLENIPTDGIVICRAKIKLKKKSHNGWGQLLLNAEQPDLAGYEWPTHRYHFESDLDQWTSKEIRYPAKVFYQKNPVQISVFFSFNMTGTIWIKDLELLHLPGPVPASTSRVPELVKLVELADQQMKTVNEQYQAGLVSYDAWLKTKVNWLNHCITLAEERKLRDEAINYLVQLKDTQDKQLQFARQLIHAGKIKESDALPIQEEIVKTELRLKQAKQKK